MLFLILIVYLEAQKTQMNAFIHNMGGYLTALWGNINIGYCMEMFCNNAISSKNLLPRRFCKVVIKKLMQPNFPHRFFSSTAGNHYLSIAQDDS